MDPRLLPATNTAPKRSVSAPSGAAWLAFPWHKHPDSVVTAVADLRPDRRENLMRTYACSTAYRSIEELVRDKNVDAVSICTDGPLHVQHVELAMKHGKHVFCAVPACWGSLDEAQWLLDIVRRYGLTYMLGETSYYYPFAISVRKYFEQGLFGEVYHCESDYLHNGLEELYFADGRRTWRHGVPPMWYPTHNTVFVTMLGRQRLTEVSCTGWGDESPICNDNFYGNPFWN